MISNYIDHLIRLPVRLCSGSRMPGHFAGRHAFCSLDAGGGRGGIWSRWGAGVSVFMGGLKSCLPQAMEFEETKPQIDADEHRLNTLPEDIRYLRKILESHAYINQISGKTSNYSPEKTSSKKLSLFNIFCHSL